MDAAWIFTPLSGDDCQAIAEACEERLRARAEEELDGAWAELCAGADEEDAFPVIHGGWDLPFLSKLKSDGRYYSGTMAPDLRKRIETCRTGIEIPLPEGKSLSPLTVSVLRFLVERAGQGAIDWGNRKPELSEVALAALKAKPGLPDFDPPPSLKPSAAPSDDGVTADQARALLALLIEGRHVEVEASSVDAVARRFAPVLASEDDVARRAVTAYEWLLEQAEIDEVFFSEEDFARILEQW